MVTVIVVTIGVVLFVEAFIFLAWRVLPVIWGRISWKDFVDFAVVMHLVVALVGLGITIGSITVAQSEGPYVQGATPTSIENASPQPRATSTAALVVAPPTSTPRIRPSCDLIRGTDYLSEDEHLWYQANCTSPPQPHGDQPTGGSQPSDGPQPEPTQASGGSVAPTATPELSVTITSPADGAAIPLYLHVSGRSRGIAPGQAPSSPPPWLYLVLRPVPESAEQSWFVQPVPGVAADGTWDAFIYAGVEADPQGTVYVICAIVTNQQLADGRYGAARPPSLASSCVTVARG